MSFIYTARYLGASQCDFSNEFNENCWVEVKLRERDKLLIGCIYRSPNSDEANNVKLNISEYIQTSPRCPLGRAKIRR